MWYLLVGIAAGLLALRPRLREGLQPTDKIKQPGRIEDGFYDPAERDRIWSLIPESIRQAAATRWGGDDAKRFVANFIADFYSDVYEKATSPITKAMIADFVQRKSVPEMYIQEASTILKAYYIDQAPPAAATGPPPPPPAGPDSTGPPPPTAVAEPSRPVPTPTTTSLESSAPVTITIQVRPSK